MMKYLVTMVVALASVAATADQPCSVLQPSEQSVIALTNAKRSAAGLSILVVDCRLMGQARRQAARMASSGSMYHGSDAVAENIAAGQNSPDIVVVDWMNSPGHRANILRRHHTKIGVAQAIGSNGTVYWVQQFR